MGAPVGVRRSPGGGDSSLARCPTLPACVNGSLLRSGPLLPGGRSRRCAAGPPARTQKNRPPARAGFATRSSPPRRPNTGGGSSRPHSSVRAGRCPLADREDTRPRDRLSRGWAPLFFPRAVGARFGPCATAGPPPGQAGLRSWPIAAVAFVEREGGLLAEQPARTAKRGRSVSPGSSPTRSRWMERPGTVRSFDRWCLVAAGAGLRAADQAPPKERKQEVNYGRCRH